MKADKENKKAKLSWLTQSNQLSRRMALSMMDYNLHVTNGKIVTLWCSWGEWHCLALTSNE